jgi:hypothetical protein
VGKLVKDISGTSLFFQPKSAEEEKLLNDPEPHPVGLLTESEIQRMLMEEYGETRKLDSN